MYDGKIRYTLILLTILLIFCQNSMAFDENRYDNDSRLQACDLFNEAKQLYGNNPSEKTLSKIESTLFEALSIIPESVDQLNFIRIESRLIHGAGHWAKYRNVRVPRSCVYQPHKLMNKIRMQIPPEPWAVADLKTDDTGSIVTVKIYNKGKSYMENIFVSISATNLPDPAPKTIDQIKPGENSLVQWSTKQNIENEPLKILFKEQYGFHPCELHF
jgi:hypothetical protein